MVLAQAMATRVLVLARGVVTHLITVSYPLRGTTELLLLFLLPARALAHSLPTRVARGPRRGLAVASSPAVLSCRRPPPLASR